MPTYRVTGTVFEIEQTSSHSTNTKVLVNIDTTVQANSPTDAVNMLKGPYQGPRYKTNLAARQM